MKPRRRYGLDATVASAVLLLGTAQGTWAETRDAIRHESDDILDAKIEALSLQDTPLQEVFWEIPSKCKNCRVQFAQDYNAPEKVYDLPVTLNTKGASLRDILVELLRQVEAKTGVRLELWGTGDRVYLGPKEAIRDAKRRAALEQDFNTRLPDDVRKRLQVRVSFDFFDEPLVKVAQHLTEATGVPFEVDLASARNGKERGSLAGRPIAITLMLKQMRAQPATAWVARMSNLTYTYARGKIVLTSLERAESLAGINNPKAQP